MPEFSTQPERSVGKPWPPAEYSYVELSAGGHPDHLSSDRRLLLVEDQTVSSSLVPPPGSPSPSSSMNSTRTPAPRPPWFEAYHQGEEGLTQRPCTWPDRVSTTMSRVRIT